MVIFCGIAEILKIDAYYNFTLKLPSLDTRFTFVIEKWVVFKFSNILIFYIEDILYVSLK